MKYTLTLPVTSPHRNRGRGKRAKRHLSGSTKLSKYTFDLIAGMYRGTRNI